MLVRVMPNYTRRQSYLYTIFDPPCNFGKGGKPLTSARGGLDFGNLPLPKSYIVFPNSDLCRPLLRRQRGSALPRSLALTHSLSPPFVA